MMGSSRRPRGEELHERVGRPRALEMATLDPLLQWCTGHICDEEEDVRTPSQALVDRRRSGGKANMGGVVALGEGTLSWAPTRKKLNMRGSH